MQVFLRIKSMDVLLCSDKLEWSSIVDGEGKFYYPACIIFTLFIKEGDSLYPKFDAEFLKKMITRLALSPIRWNEACNSLGDKYKEALFQTRPTHRSPKKKDPQVQHELPEYTSKAFLLGKHDRQSSSGSCSPQK